MAEWYDAVIDTAKNESVTLAQDWIRNTASANRPQVQVAPQPVATMPAAQIQSQMFNNKYLIYGLIAVAVLGLVYLFKPRKGKK